MKKVENMHISPHGSNTMLPAGWIETREQKPGNEPVLAWYDMRINGNAAVVFYEDGKWFLFHSSAGDEPIKEPTYWMPLPCPPACR